MRRPRKPTNEQSSYLAQIARFSLMKSFSADGKTQWQLTNGKTVPEPIARALIRNFWVIPQRDGLGLFDETQTYIALVPKKSLLSATEAVNDRQQKADSPLSGSKSVTPHCCGFCGRGLAEVELLFRGAVGGLKAEICSNCVEGYAAVARLWQIDKQAAALSVAAHNAIVVRVP